MFELVDNNRDKRKEFETKAEAEDKKQDMIGLGARPEDLEVKKVGDIEAEHIDHTEAETEPEQTEATPEVVEEPEVVEPVEQLAKDPIAWLEGQNSSFVNTIKGTPAISKQGFRFIQSKFGITTQSEVVHTFDDPTGVVVWAKAELPDGQCAEAHGEGYLTERDVGDNEFVRYADTRAKNRAISDLTSAGALAVSELSGDN